MVQFKDVFTGHEKRDYTRATTSQKCVRAGGKHNDLDEVGKTTRHHTFFEMLGNFSFGDYFKEQAIEWAWDLLVDKFKIDPKRLICTVHKGDKNLGIGLDTEAKSLWKKTTGFDDSRILALGTQENFWMMGDTGPMGPCSEIHYYIGDGDPVLPPDDENHPLWDNWLEIWNLVFMQYDRKTPGGVLEPLPAPSIDTGAGLERLVSVLQHVSSNYDTDLFNSLLHKTARIARTDYGKNEKTDLSIRVIADHARAAAFLITDGVFPDKTNREYVLRRIFRRAVRHGKIIGIDKPFMHQVCEVVIDEMADSYPELKERKPIIENVCLEEEKLFRRTIDRGLAMLEDEFKTSSASRISGQTIFKLYDTYGFPDDLTEIIANEHGFSVDREGFQKSLTRAKNMSREASGDKAYNVDNLKNFANKHPATEFLGYTEDVCEGAKVLGLYELNVQANDGQSKPPRHASRLAVVFNKTVLYGESGGQVGDKGTLSNKSNEYAVVDTLKPDGETYVHIIEDTNNAIAVGDVFNIKVDRKRRRWIRSNHSATHLLHRALKNILGTHVAQKGSLVDEHRLRFDFSHFKPMTVAELKEVEFSVNSIILSNASSKTEVLPIEEAKKRGAVAMFGEKYGDNVRIVQIGTDSLEFCGGTHIKQAGEVGLFKIVSENGVAQGVRRIEARTGVEALKLVTEQENLIQSACDRLKCAPTDLSQKLIRLLEEQKILEKENQKLRKKLATGGNDDLMNHVKVVEGHKVLVTEIDAHDAKTLRETGDHLKNKIGEGVVVLFGRNDSKALVVAMVTKNLTSQIHAGKIMQFVAQSLGGRGGGRPDMAQGGGPDIVKIPDAIKIALETVREMAQ